MFKLCFSIHGIHRTVAISLSISFNYLVSLSHVFLFCNSSRCWRGTVQTARPAGASQRETKQVAWASVDLREPSDIWGNSFHVISGHFFLSEFFCRPFYSVLLLHLLHFLLCTENLLSVLLSHLHFVSMLWSISSALSSSVNSRRWQDKRVTNPAKK